MTITLEEKEIKEVVQKYLGDRYTIDSINIINGRLRNKDRLEVTARLAENDSAPLATDVVKEPTLPGIDEEPIFKESSVFGGETERIIDGKN